MNTEEKEQTRSAWNAIAAGYDEFVTPSNIDVGADVLRRAGLRAGMRFLDVAAGSGGLSIPAARLGAQVLSVDISPIMIDRLQARGRNEGLNIESRVMDGHTLDLENDTFDMAGSQFGVMLFPDMPRGTRELVRVTKPGGTVVLIALGSPEKIEFFNFFLRAIQSIVPGFAGPPMDPPPLPFQLQDPERLKQEFVKAGLQNVRVEKTSETLEFSSGTDMWNWVMNSNPFAGAVLGQLTLSKEQIASARQALDSLVRERAAGSERAVLTTPINIGIGTK
jgi:ubiquinone/menaquinone biosynthesis C-methylase UbiE